MRLKSEWVKALPFFFFSLELFCESFGEGATASSSSQFPTFSFRLFVFREICIEKHFKEGRSKITSRHGKDSLKGDTTTWVASVYLPTYLHGVYDTVGGNKVTE